MLFVLQARAQAAKQSVDKVIKRTPKAPKKRKLRDEPTHLRFESEWSDTEPSETVSKKQKKQVSAISTTSPTHTPPSPVIRSDTVVLRDMTWITPIELCGELFRR